MNQKTSAINAYQFRRFGGFDSRAASDRTTPGGAAPRRRCILYLTHRIPFPPDKGDKIRSYHWLKHLASRHDVFLACFIDDARDRRHVLALRTLCRDVLAIPVSSARMMRRAGFALVRDTLRGRRDPLTLAAYDHPAMRHRLALWSRMVEFDAVLAFSAAMAPYALNVSARRRVLDLCDCDSRKWLDYAAALRGRSVWRPARWLNPIYQREGRSLHDAELSWVGRFDATTVVNDKERRLLRMALPASRVHIVRNGVAAVPATPIPAAPILGFVGVLDYRPNIEALEWFINDIWPRIRVRQPDAVFHVIGRSPGRVVKRLSRRPGIRLIGPVDDITTQWSRLRVAVAPLRTARGIQNKVLEAMAHGRPVVTTTRVAEGLAHSSGAPLLSADGAAEFADAACRLIESDELCQSLGAAGRRHVREQWDWTGPTGDMERLILGAPAGSGGRPARRRRAPRRRGGGGARAGAEAAAP
ncbi:MAG: TIGR03087 family PEP-CTERM/XrtA system glycosyltransferase, partial [Phycisphaerae bacterium]